MNLSWTNNDELTEGFLVFASTDAGETWVNVTDAENPPELNTGDTWVYTDLYEADGQTVLYKVIAVAPGRSSQPSATDAAANPPVAVAAVDRR